LFMAGITLYIAGSYFLTGSLFTDISIKIFASFLFPFVCLLVGCFEKRELIIIKKVGLKWRNPGDWLKNLRNEMQNLKR